MNKAELKELIKQVVAEETEYQKLFKTMLDRSGKDINSMSDEEKKKFFSAVDKAYKAKSEGKLVDSKKKDKLNESVLGILLSLLALGPFVYHFFLLSFDKIAKFILRKDVKEACERIWPKLADNKAFLKHVQEILEETGGKFLMTEPLAWKIITTSKFVVKLADEERDRRIAEKEKKGEKSLMIRDDILNGLSSALSNAWNDKSIQNVLVNKLKNDIK